MKNIILFIIGGVVLLNLAGITPEDIRHVAQDFRTMVDQELEDWRNQRGPRPSLTPTDEGPVSIAASRPYS